MDEREEKVVERRISLLEAKDEELGKEVSIAEKKKALAEMKKSYGSDWKSVLFGAARKLRINKETMQTLHSMGGNQRLRDLNDPRQFGSGPARRNVFRE